jgi:hypothetical protein
VKKVAPKKPLEETEATRPELPANFKMTPQISTYGGVYLAVVIASASGAEDPGSNPAGF